MSSSDDWEDLFTEFEEEKIQEETKKKDEAAARKAEAEAKKAKAEAKKAKKAKKAEAEARKARKAKKKAKKAKKQAEAEAEQAKKQAEAKKAEAEQAKKKAEAEAEQAKKQAESEQAESEEESESDEAITTSSTKKRKIEDEVYVQELQNKRPSQYYHFVSNKKQNKVLIDVPLLCRQCEFVFKTGPKTGLQCKRSVCIGIPFCRDHMRSALHLEIKPSRIPNAGMGLFAYRPENTKNDDPVFPGYYDVGEKRRNRGRPRKGLQPLNKKFIVVEYMGRLVSTDKLQRLYKDNTVPYAVEIDSEATLDAAQVRGAASLANDAYFSHLPSQFKNNCMLVQWGKQKKIYIKATRNIYHGDELYCDYGHVYDDTDMPETIPGEKEHSKDYELEDRDLVVMRTNKRKKGPKPLILSDDEEEEDAS